MTVALAMQDDVGVITIDDGGKNVINHSVLDEFEQAWQQAKSVAKGVVLAGRVGCFCAGFDVSVMTGGDPVGSTRLGQRGGRMALELFSSPMPTVVAATGHSLTIGAVWMASCDVRIAEEGAHKIGLLEVALNVPFSFSWPLHILESRLNKQHLVPAVLHSRIYDPQGAIEAGFVDQVVPAGAGLDSAIAQASELAKLPGKAYSISKRRLRAEAIAAIAADLESNL